MAEIRSTIYPWNHEFSTSDIKIAKLRPFLREFPSSRGGIDTIGLANKENEKAEEATIPQE